MQERSISMRGHHLSLYAPYLLSDGKEGRIPYEDTTFGNRIKKCFEMMRTIPDLEVYIVKGLDSICGDDCPDYNEEKCLGRTDYFFCEDQLTLNKLDLKVADEPYKAETINQSIRDHYEKTGFKSPRETLMNEFRKLPSNSNKIERFIY